MIYSTRFMNSVTDGRWLQPHTIVCKRPIPTTVFGDQHHRVAAHRHHLYTSVWAASTRAITHMVFMDRKVRITIACCSRCSKATSIQTCVQAPLGYRHITHMVFLDRKVRITSVCCSRCPAPTTRSACNLRPVLGGGCFFYYAGVQRLH